MLRFQALLVLWVCGGAVALGQSVVELETGTFNPSERCGECHEEIYATWRRSLHSAAVNDPVFEASYVQAYRETAGEARNVCLRCHAPVAVVTGDLDLQQSLSREGITCDFCHSIVSVDLERRGQPFRIRLDGVKHGPLAEADSPVHGVARSQLHESSEFCAGCHEYANDHGLSILSTYTEWKASPQAKEGKTCQHCHMPLAPGETVRPEFGTNRKTINLHNISGGHSREQVRSAAALRILTVERRRPTLAVVEVEVANVGSGHSIPTGMPTRKLTLEVLLFSGQREARRFERHYEKALLDGKGQLVVDDHRAILEARTVRDDTRLRPGERRTERFVAPVPAEGNLRVEARLLYSYEPKILMRERMAIEMAADKFPGVP